MRLLSVERWVSIFEGEVIKVRREMKLSCSSTHFVNCVLFVLRIRKPASGVHVSVCVNWSR